MRNPTFFLAYFVTFALQKKLRGRFKNEEETNTLFGSQRNY